MLIRDDRKEGRVVVRRFYFDIIVEESWKRKPPEELKNLKIKLKKKKGRICKNIIFILSR